MKTRSKWPIEIGLQYQGRQRYRNIREIVGVDVRPPAGQDTSFKYLAYRIVDDENRAIRIGQVRTMRVKEFRRWCQRLVTPDDDGTEQIGC